MAKFYIECGNLKSCIDAKTWLEGIRKIFYQKVTEVSLDQIRLGPFISINEIGFIFDLLEDVKYQKYFDKEYVEWRKSKKNAYGGYEGSDFETIDLKEGDIIVVPRNKLFEYLGIG